MGMCANLFVWFVLIRAGSVFSVPLVTLLKHQSFIDAVACLFTFIIIVQPFMWLTGNAIFDVILCQIWHSQGLYWLSVFISAQNLICVASERYLAVCRPFVYMQLRKRKVIIALLFVYMYGILILSGACFQARYRDGKCTPDFAFDNTAMKQFFFVFSFIWFATFYAFPCIAFCILYFLVLKTLRKSKKMSQDMKHGDTKTVDKASGDLTKTAITVTIIFVVSMAFDSYYYILGYTGITTYEVNTPLQKIGVFFVTFNSVANPFVYAILMPVFRASVRLAFHLGPAKDKTGSVKTNSESIGSQLSVASKSYCSHL